MRSLASKDRRSLQHAADASVSWSDLGIGAKIFRVAHLAWGAASLTALGYIWSSALARRRDRLLAASVAFLGIEGVALVIGRGNCPFGPFQRRLGDPVPMFELVLPPRAAKAAIRILAVVTLAGFAALVVRRPLSGKKRSVTEGGAEADDALLQPRGRDHGIPGSDLRLLRRSSQRSRVGPDARAIEKLGDLLVGQGSLFKAPWAGAPRPSSSSSATSAHGPGRPSRRRSD